MAEKAYITTSLNQKNSNNFLSTGSERPFFKSILHPKLTVNAPNDIYEKEADAVADQVMRMPDPQLQMQSVEEEEKEKLQMKPEPAEKLQMNQQVPGIQRMCPRCQERAKQVKPLDCPDCEKKLQLAPAVQRQGDGQVYASSGVTNQLSSSKGRGTKLPNSVQQEMSLKMGTDFSGVNIHTDPKAYYLNQQLGARAFTHGRHIYFNRGEYSPDSLSGKHLLAHELTHVVQQQNSSKFIQRQGFVSTMEICHNYLRSRTFRISTGGIRVTTNARISDPNNPNCRNHRFSIELRKEGLIFNDPYGTCDFSTSNQPDARAWGGLPDGEYYLGINRLYNNPYCCLEGDIEVTEESGIDEGSCTEAPPGPLEILHSALQAAGLIPALGVVPDAIDTGLYIIEGDWTDAGISAAAMLPIFGQGATLTRSGLKVSGEFVEKTGRGGIETALRRARRLLRTMRAPRAVPYGRTTGSIDLRLVERAKEVRATQAGVTAQAFRQHNVATARVRVDGEIRYLDTGNMPSGAHSEEYIHAQITALRHPHDSVTLEQLYSERIPCRPTCGPLLSREYPNADVFYTTRANSPSGRVRELMEQYGVTPGL